VRAAAQPVNPLMLDRVSPAWKLLHEDEALLVVDKPAGLLAVPGKGEAGQQNLFARLGERFADALIVHRLDMATSGLMLFARGADMQRALSITFEQHQVHKRYVALVEGEPDRDTGEIDLPLSADWPNRPRQQVDLAHGRPSLTRWRVLERSASQTRLELEPVTGRSHQLRVHLMHLGHPIAGDTLYGGAPAPRLMLHAAYLAFAHPRSGAPCAFESPVPF
jgi:tRNA pseudouridine32 synthase / 23S rRNA pseudouridine746 synthase